MTQPQCVWVSCASLSVHPVLRPQMRLLGHQSPQSRTMIWDIHMKAFQPVHPGEALPTWAISTPNAEDS